VVLLDKLFNGTRGSLTVDLKRPQLPRDERARTTLLTVRRHPERRRAASHPLCGAFSGFGYAPPPHAGGPPYRRRHPSGQPQPPQPPPQGYVDHGELPDVAFGDSGARVKALRHVHFGPQFELTKYGRTSSVPCFDLGAGLEFCFDTASLRPLARLKFRDVASLRALPAPALKLQKRVLLGTSGFCLRLAYECPLDSLARFFAPPARFMAHLDNAVDSGVRVTQSGLEFAANLWLLDGGARLRGGGILRLPSQLPVDEDEALVGFEVRRLGLKARW